MSLETALREARSANAHLPLPALDISIASEKEKEARAEMWLKVALEGDFVYAPPGYAEPLTNLGNARLQAVVRQPIYAGGSLKAGVARAGAGVEAARGRYRLIEMDLELEVRSRFSELLQIDSEIAIRRTGLEELETYRSSLRSRQAAGQGIAADLLKTEVRVALEEATLADTEQRRDDARLSLNELMGRDPTAPLELVPLPLPEAPAAGDPAAWQNAPEVRVAEASARSAEADTIIAKAETRPQPGLPGRRGLLDRRHDPSGQLPVLGPLLARRRVLLRPRLRLERLGPRRGAGPHRGGEPRPPAVAPGRSRSGGATRAWPGRRRTRRSPTSTSRSRSSRARSPTRATPTSTRRAATAAAPPPPSRSSTPIPPPWKPPFAAARRSPRYRVADAVALRWSTP